MVRVVEWEFPTVSPAYMFSKELVIGNKLILSSLQTKDWNFGIVGLGLAKAEREIFGHKRFKLTDIIHIYCGRWLITYNRNGYKNQMQNVKITSDKVII